MSAISITLTPGYQFSPGEMLSYAKLNALGNPALQLNGQLGTAQLTNQSVTTAILADQSVTEGKMVSNTFTPDANGVAAFAKGWLSNLNLAQGLAAVQNRTNCVVTNITGVNTSSTTVSATLINITADELVLKDTNGNQFVATNVSVQANCATSGVANGLDTGALAASTWYYIYAIYNPTTLTVASLVSLTAPTLQALGGVSLPLLPSGYTYLALVGAAITNSSNQLLEFRVVNRRAFFPEVSIMSNYAATTSWAAYTTNVNLAVPLIAKIMHGTLGVNLNSSSVGLAGDITGMGAVYATSATSSYTIDGFLGATAFSLPLLIGQTVFVKAGVTNPGARLICTGYEF